MFPLRIVIYGKKKRTDVVKTRFIKLIYKLVIFILILKKELMDIMIPRYRGQIKKQQPCFPSVRSLPSLRT